jgi:putative heme-binding domain-containing protein
MNLTMYRNTWVKLLVAFFCLSLLGSACKNQGSDNKNDNSKNQDPRIAKLKLPPGFHAEHLYSPKEHGQGSWVAMTFDDKGRIIASDQYGNLYRVTVPPVGFDSTKTGVKVEKLPVNIPNDTSFAKIEIGFAHGLLYAFNSLYITVNDEGEGDSITRKSGLYRLQDTNNDDVFDKLTLLKTLKGEGEHGPHSPVLSPDKKSLYLIAGNFTELPKMDNYRLPNTWKNDNLFPLLLDPNGFGNTTPPPGGWIAKTDSAGTYWDLVSAGYRNPFDMAFNEDGELFTFDSDMEWDFGLPWYRPIRICNVTSGSEYGYRENNGKWSPSYPDNLPPVINIGQGSPTNVMSGNNARFPEKYRRGLFTFDWSYGIIYHIDLQPDGSSYKGNAEEFISGSPLPLTDGAIGPDGAMYFLTGGRKIESDVYRVYYGDNSTKEEPLASNESADVTEARKIRHQLEAFQQKPDAAALNIAWPYLNNKDRFIRYAARIAIEHQPVSQWQSRALAEKDPVALTQAMIALARNGSKGAESQILNALMSIDYSKLSEPQQIDLLRAFEVTLSRMGKPDGDENARLISYLEPNYPAAANQPNRLLCKILVFVQDPQAVSKTLALIDNSKDDDDQKTAMQSSDLILRNQQYGIDVANMLANKPPTQQIYLATVLATAKNGWTPELREKYFPLFYTFLEKKGGNSYAGYINEARKLALTGVPKKDFAHYNTISGDSLAEGGSLRKLAEADRPKGPGRDWKLDEAVAVVDSANRKIDMHRGKTLFATIACASCHKFNGEGGSIGPDLTQLGTRFTSKDILESIINPSKEVSDQYAATLFYLKDGSTVLGRLVKQDDDKYYVSQNPFAPQQLREVAKKDVTSKKLSDASIMPPGLINSLNPEELSDLLAYLKSAGGKNDNAYNGAGK